MCKNIVRAAIDWHVVSNTAELSSASKDDTSLWKVISETLIAMSAYGHLVSLAVCTASAEMLGWGFVTNADVALRHGAGGKVVYRLPKDACVWINDSEVGGNGAFWYEIRTGLHVAYANNDFSGRLKAEFIDAGVEV